MSETDDKSALAELTEPEPPAGSERYLAWAERKIRKSLEADDAAPERRKALESLMKERGPLLCWG